MEKPGPVTLEVALGEGETFGAVHVDLAAFCDFDASLDQKLQQLVDRWERLAAPASAHPRHKRVSRKFV
jgi:hypothetical protein